jgi:hypothetical protein
MGYATPENLWSDMPKCPAFSTQTVEPNRLSGTAQEKTL